MYVELGGVCCALSYICIFLVLKDNVFNNTFLIKFIKSFSNDIKFFYSNIFI